MPDKMHLSVLNALMQAVSCSMNERIIETYKALKRFDKFMSATGISEM